MSVKNNLKFELISSESSHIVCLLIVFTRVRVRARRLLVVSSCAVLLLHKKVKEGRQIASARARSKPCSATASARRAADNKVKSETAGRRRRACMRARVRAHARIAYTVEGFT